MKIITLTQPWATLMITGEKEIETRSWNLRHRGILGIHAAKGWSRMDRDICGTEPFKSALSRHGYSSYEQLPLGVILGWVELYGTLETGFLRRLVGGISSKELAFGDYTPGRFAWLTRSPVRCANPISAKGSLGVWAFDLELGAGA